MQNDARIDPRLKQAFATLEVARPPGVESRDAILAALASLGGQPDASLAGILGQFDYVAVSPVDDMDREVRSIVSSPDGNRINLLIFTPKGRQPDGCVFYIHGGGMMTMSCFDENYQAWGRMIARGGVTVVMVDFRNALAPSSVADVAPYPAGLNDCISAWAYLCKHGAAWGIDPDRIVLAGDSGGANLALALALSLKRSQTLRAKALYLTCPYLAGTWPGEPGSSALENAGIIMDLRSNFVSMAYGIDALLAEDPLAWPGFATEQDLARLPPTIINVNECDPLRDDGIVLFRKMLGAGVAVRCRQLMGTVHGTEVFVVCCPDISRDVAREIGHLCYS